MKYCFSSSYATGSYTSGQQDAYAVPTGGSYGYVINDLLK